MTLIQSISGIRGTIGGLPTYGLTPSDIVNFTSAFATIIHRKSHRDDIIVVAIGRDARVSGSMVSHIVAGTLQGCGINVIDLGLSTTPTVEMAVKDLKADGGIIITASHNPGEWNALKLLNAEGEFFSAADGEELLKIVEKGEFLYAEADRLGSYSTDDSQLRKHIRAILGLELVDADAIRRRDFRVAFDAINSSGGVAIPLLLKELGVEDVVGINDTPDGLFAHNPEPLAENLGGICTKVVESGADVGFVVDPDVDRLAMVMENGGLFGEEYTLVAVADYILQHRPGNTVSNLSSTRALQDVTEKHGGKYFASAVGEVNVVEKMKEVGAVIGGEGNGGVIYPELHHGRDALVGIALFLTWLAKSGKKCSELRKTYPDYFISKNKIQLSEGLDPEKVIRAMAEKYAGHPVNLADGMRIDFEGEWVHLRKSNTEPIIRIYAESREMKSAEALARRIMEEVSRIPC